MATWVFGYGSLVWRPDFPFVERRPARIDGWSRRFWQGSPDHRGVPEAPGRVVTLVRAAGQQTVGTAYRVHPDHAQRVLAALDHREKAGYDHHRLTMHTPEGPVEGGLVYVAGPGNPSWLGSAPLLEMARHIARSKGPSGTNAEYLLRLAEALRGLGADDPHVFALEGAVRALAGDGAPG